MNIVLLIGAMAALNATLTLPGIAGIILAIGMAVDSNVLMLSVCVKNCAPARHRVQQWRAATRRHSGRFLILM